MSHGCSPVASSSLPPAGGGAGEAGRRDLSSGSGTLTLRAWSGGWGRLQPGATGNLVPGPQACRSWEIGGLGWGNTGLGFSPGLATCWPWDHEQVVKGWGRKDLTNCQIYRQVKGNQYVGLASVQPRPSQGLRPLPNSPSSSQGFPRRAVSAKIQWQCGTGSESW